MPKELLEFIIPFVIPMIWYRALFELARELVFTRSLTRKKLQLQIHHLHYGVILVLIAAVLLLVNSQRSIVIILLGLGLGLIMDLFIASIKLETDREQELIVYKKSLIPTVILFAVVSGLAFVLYYIFT